jgi:hypothetical protein
MAQKPRIDEALLIPKQQAMEQWQKLQSGIRASGSLPCQKNPTPYIDDPYTVSDDEAEELCYKCPLLRECYQFAKANNEEYGIWGGVNFTSAQHIEEMF